jgi:oxygen-independent coproporphyrinogen-3 oxidase
VGNSFFSIYVHIPFCIKKCNYCSFYSIPFEKREIINDFIDSISKEVELRYEIIEKYFSLYKTLYFGGGTPSVLNLDELEKLLNIFYRIKKFEDLDEVTFELNPDTIDENKLKLLKDYGVNRISIGLESSIDKYLEFLGRIYRFNTFVKKYEVVRKYFDNVNIDIIYGIPNQTEDEFIKDVLALLNFKPEHISAYALEIHKETPFENLKVDEDLQSKFYFILKEMLEKNGYIHYEISNFSLPYKQSRHNINYWIRGNYLSFGPSACSLIENLRWKNISDVLLYNFSFKNGKIELEYKEKLSEIDIMNERLILGLRMMNGVNINDELYSYYKDKISNMINYFEIGNERLKIKKEYLFVSNYILSRIII